MCACSRHQAHTHTHTQSRTRPRFAHSDGVVAASPESRSRGGTQDRPSMRTVLWFCVLSILLFLSFTQVLYKTDQEVRRRCTAVSTVRYGRCSLQYTSPVTIRKQPNTTHFRGFERQQTHSCTPLCNSSSVRVRRQPNVLHFVGDKGNTETSVERPESIDAAV
jgi:hypothetical protein